MRAKIRAMKFSRVRADNYPERAANAHIDKHRFSEQQLNRHVHLFTIMGSYYDIDAILTDAQKVPCTFDLDIPGLGYLDENAGGDVPLPLSISFHSTSPSSISSFK